MEPERNVSTPGRIGEAPDWLYFRFCRNTLKRINQLAIYAGWGNLSSRRSWGDWTKIKRELATPG